jgi:hypothetical protein
VARIIVCGYMIRHPLAGNVLAYFHYVLGLERLGHEVLYLEESGWPRACYDPVSREYGDDPHAGLRVVRALLGDYGVKAPVCYVNRESGKVEGADWDDLKQMLRVADLLLNIGGVCWLPQFRLCRRRAFVDMDPLFTQVGRFGAEALYDHHVHLSYGANIGSPGCAVPTGGIDWLPTVPPVVAEVWENQRAPAGGAFTTIGNWSAYGDVTYRGARYGQKDRELLRLLDLPSRTSQRLELALSGAGSEMTERLRAAGWVVRDGGDVSTDMASYRAYIAGSRGEFSAAKHGYVKARSGWFSDRSVCYLAAGLPVILQDTGFTDWLPAGRGVLAFSSVDEAADRIERVNAEYPAHRGAAREIAARTFGHTVVLPRLLEAALGTPVSYAPIAEPGRAP